MSDTEKDLELQIRQLDSKLLNQRVASMLLDYATEVIDGMSIRKVPDSEKYARKIVAFLREHLVR